MSESPSREFRSINGGKEDLTSLLSRIETQLRSNRGGGDGMEPRIAKLEASVDHIERDIGELKTDVREFRADMRDVRDRLAQLEEKVFHLPSKGFIVGTVLLMLAVVTAVGAFQHQIQQFVGATPISSNVTR